MGIIIILISISLVIAVGFLLSFLWSLRSGQFDDTYSPSVRMLFDDKPQPANDEKNERPTRIEPSEEI
jgi:cbb3-type cytochrome oxidase maturation protein